MFTKVSVVLPPAARAVSAKLLLKLGREKLLTVRLAWVAEPPTARPEL